MPKLYVFAIGGTGSRVLKSLVMLLASGIKIEADKIVPMIIDTDANNGDLEYLRRVISCYRDVNQKLYQNAPHGYYPNGFFRTEIEPPKELNISGSDYGDLKSMIDYDTLNASGYTSTKGVLDMLFNEQTKQMDLEEGFLGTPSVGSIVLSDIVKSKGFKQFTQEFQNGDRIFIISSIFGGTGAAGFPLLLNLFRDPESGIANNQLIKDSIIGGLSLQPYFEVDQDKYENGDSVIDSSTFITKTKAALAYYQDYISQNINALFFAGDYRRSNYDNFQGGENQRNPANFLEFISALSIIRFMDYEKDANAVTDLTNYSKYFEFGIAEDASELNLTHLGKTNDELVKQLVQFMYFSLFVTNYLNSALGNKKLTWTNEIQVPANFHSNELVKKIKEFCGTHFYQWLYQLQREHHGRKFVPFYLQVMNEEEVKDYMDQEVKLNVDDDYLFNVVSAIPANKNNGIFKKDKIDFNDLFNNKVDEITQDENIKTFEVKLISLLYEGVNSIYEKRFLN